MSSFTLGPRRGSGITDGGFVDLTDWESYTSFESNPHYAAFNGAERSAMRALIAFAVLIILAAAVSLVMVIFRSWLKPDGRRKKLRLTTFIFCLVFLIAGRATLIDDLVERMRQPPRFRELFYFDEENFYSRQTVIVLFSWLSDILIFCIALVEITRSNGQTKRTLFETANFVFVAILFIVAAAAWGYDLAWTWSTWMEAPMDMPRAAIAGLFTAYAVAAFLFSTELMIVLTRYTLPKPRRILLISFISALWLGQVLHLANTTVQEFSSNANAFTSALALSAVVNLVWAVKVLLVALLAWNSHKTSRSDSAQHTLHIGTEHKHSSEQKASHSSSVGSAAPLNAQTPQASV